MPTALSGFENLTASLHYKTSGILLKSLMKMSDYSVIYIRKYRTNVIFVLKIIQECSILLQAIYLERDYMSLTLEIRKGLTH